MKKFAIFVAIFACINLSICFASDSLNEIIDEDIIVASALDEHVEKTSQNNDISVIGKEENENLNDDLPLYAHIYTVAALIFLVARFFNHIGESGTRFKIRPTEKVEYVRNLELDGITPGQAAFMADTLGVKTADIFKATLLRLKQRDLISFEFVGAETQITLLGDNADLDVEEGPIFAFLVYFMKATGCTDKFLLSDLQKYMLGNSQKVAILKKRIMSVIKSAIPFYDPSEHNKLTAMTKNIVIYTVLALVTYILCSRVKISLMAIPTWVYIMIFLNILLCVRIISKINLFDQVGVDNREKFKAFKKYMSEFSTKDLGIPRIEKWDKYSPYAAAFGIGKIVINQLQKAYPNVSESKLRDLLIFYQRLDECDLEKSFMQAASTSLLML